MQIKLPLQTEQNVDKEATNPLDTSIDELKLPLRARNVLASKHLKTVRDVLEFGLDNVGSIHNAGQKTVNTIASVIKPFIEVKNLEQIPFNRNIKTECKENTNNLSFEDLIKRSFEENLLKTTIEDLGLPIRAFNGLKKANLKTVIDIVNFGLEPLKRMRNIGYEPLPGLKAGVSGLLA